MRELFKTGGQLVLILLATAALGAARTISMPAPGTVNYVEGEVALEGRSLSEKSVGSAQVEAKQVLDTGQGKAELLLTPGVFFRLGDHSKVRMVSAGLANTKVELVKGVAMLEVAELFKENDLSVAVGGRTARIDKTGLYDFNADQPAVGVLDGKATVFEGDAHVTLKKGHQAVLSGQALKFAGINKKTFENNDLYRWSRLRSEYESEANMDAARTVVVAGGWYGPGWYWDPFWSFYAFVPGNGILYSPFGWGFYSPGWVVVPRYHYPAAGVVHFRSTPQMAHHIEAPVEAPHVGSMGGGSSRR
jgi:hypothetical protein